MSLERVNHKHIDNPIMAPRRSADQNGTEYPQYIRIDVDPECRYYWMARVGKKSIQRTVGLVNAATPKDIVEISKTAILKQRERQFALKLPSAMVERGVPLIHKLADLSEFSRNTLLSARKIKKHGLSFYISGNPGTGKTHLSSALLKQDLQNNKQVEMISFSELLSKIKDTFKSDSKASESQIIEKYSQIECLYIDDLGTEKVTEWVLSVVFQLIDRRYGNLKQTTFSSNLTISDMKTIYGVRIHSRVEEMCSLVVLDGSDQRQG